jgi:hypothetical protein
MSQRRGMPRRDDNVVPFRRRPRKWTRPQDFGHDPRKRPPRPPRPPKGPKRDWHTLAAWAAIAALVALTVAWNLWG